jgi:hypothetical protein
MADDMDIDGLEPLEFPPTDTSRLAVGPSGQTVRWIENAANGGKEPTIYARILAGYDSHKQMYEDTLALVSIQKIFPMAVHTSPLYLMLSRCNEQNAYRDLYISSFTAMKYLKQMLFYYFTTYATVAAESKKHANFVMRNIDVGLWPNKFCAILSLRSLLTAPASFSIPRWH